MAYDKQKVLDVAASEVGYLEKASESQLDDKTANAGSGNYTKYSRDLAKYPYFNGRKQGVAWCAVFVAWCFVEAYGKDAALKLLCQPTKPANNAGAGCKYARSYFANKGQLHDSPEPGDVIFFYSSDKSSIQHQGIVYKVDSSKVYTIEGNTSGASGVISNGGGVCKKSYSLSYAKLAGFGRPAYGTVTDTSSESIDTSTDTSTSYTTYTVQKGDTLWRIAQKYLGNGNRYKEIKQLNGLQSDLLNVGQTLKIAKQEEQTQPEPEEPKVESGTFHTVQQGDTLWKISKKYLGKGNRYREIQSANGLNGTLIRVGQKLKIPKG